MADFDDSDGFGCALCYGQDAQATWRFYGERLHCAHRLVDDSHFDVSICRCPECGQHYVWIFTEFIDWEDGEDPQYRDVLPVTPAEVRTLVSAGAGVDLKQIEALGNDRSRLVVNHPKGERYAARPKQFFWSSGGLVIMPGC